jgi:hypothetical protein
LGRWNCIYSGSEPLCMGKPHRSVAVLGPRLKAFKAGLRGSPGTDRGISFICLLGTQAQGKDAMIPFGFVVGDNAIYRQLRPVSCIAS